MKLRIGDKVKLATKGTIGTVENSDHLTGRIRVRLQVHRSLTDWWSELDWEIEETRRDLGVTR